LLVELQLQFIITLEFKFLKITKENENPRLLNVHKYQPLLYNNVW